MLPRAARRDAGNVPPGGSPGNPVIDVEPDTITVSPDWGMGGVVLEIVDSAGSGFRTILDWPKAMDCAIRLAVTVATMRGILKP